ncbi:hypothetical protein GPUN_1587 [Glaciecola punicea ACAM 611]|jgi:hypothetical protein|uniref:Uncharacterized protein n=1 Tax=Glaciecola punicea ACAM 611 TaxID=1121923 RepID=H5TBM7_9ALTE|nr:hypothetical protein [Glaciecola punicea]GAB55704.1 hypothetical protein GPUN_1587 [Glaciecola punicea ACAM 611]
MTNNEFLDYCKSELTNSLHNTKLRKPDDKQKYRTEGLLHAARLMGLMSVQQVSHMIATEHQAFLGKVWSNDKRVRLH